MRWPIVAVLSFVLTAGCLAEVPVAPSSEATWREAAHASGAPRFPTPGEGTARVRETWAGVDEIVLFEGRLSLAPQVDLGDGRCLPRCQHAVVTPGDTLVLPGTEAVEVTATPAELPPGTRLHLLYDTGLGGPTRDADLAPGEPLAIAIEAGMEDAPLQPISHWYFGFGAYAEAAGPAAPVDVDVRVVARRAPTIPEIAEPRDPWGGASEIRLLSPMSLANTAASTPAIYVCPDCDGNFAAADGVLALGTARVRVHVAWDWVGGAPYALLWHPTLEGIPLEVVEDGANARTFEAAIEPGAWDHPSQTKSLWWIVVAVDRGGLPVGLLDGTATLEAFALRDAST